LIRIYEFKNRLHTKQIKWVFYKIIYAFCQFLWRVKKYIFLEMTKLELYEQHLNKQVLSHCQKGSSVVALYAGVTRLGIDEQSHRKGKKDYLCILTDLDKGMIATHSKKSIEQGKDFIISLMK
jgi:hypothetical protein